MKIRMLLQNFLNAIVLQSNDACLCSGRHDLWIFLLLSQTLDCCKNQFLVEFRENSNMFVQYCYCYFRLNGISFEFFIALLYFIKFKLTTL